MRKEYVYGIGGVVVGILAALLVTVFLMQNNNLSTEQKAVQVNAHEMGDGTVMSNSHTSMTMDDMVDTLMGKSGDEFDKAFLEGMIEHHEGAVEMAKLVSESAKHQELRDMAKAIISAQTSEIEMMSKWQKDWGYNK